MSKLISCSSLIEAIGKNTSHIDIINIINALPSTRQDTVHMLKRESMKDEFNCPNCGAPITSTECPYCGSVF